MKFHERIAFRSFVLFLCFQKIFLEFDFVFIPIPLDEYLRDGCRRGAVKFWTPGVDEEKISLCGDRRNLRLNGVGQNLFIELLVIDPLIDFRFRMRYRFIENESSFFYVELSIRIGVSLSGSLTTPSFLNDLSPQSSNGEFKTYFSHKTTRSFFRMWTTGSQSSVSIENRRRSTSRPAHFSVASFTL